MRFLHVVQDLALALIFGGIAGAALCAGLLFDGAPSREIAGEIGSAIFAALGPAVLILSVVAVAAHIALVRFEPGSPGRASTFLLIGLTTIALLVALWLTPRMISIWNESPHAEDGGGLIGDARREFFMLHGLTNLGYVSMAITAAILVIMRSRKR